MKQLSMITTRRCLHCDADISHRHGLAHYCSKKCKLAANYRRNKHLWDAPEQVEARRKYRKENRAAKNAASNRWAKENRARINGRRAKRRAENPQQHLDQCRKWREENREKYAEIHSRRRAKKRETQVLAISADEIDKRMALFGGDCCYCGARPQKLEADHFLPLSRGGGHLASNLLPACRSCNAKKHNHDPAEWFAAQEFFSESRWRRILKAVGKKGQDHGQLALL